MLHVMVERTSKSTAGILQPTLLQETVAVTVIVFTPVGIFADSIASLIERKNIQTRVAHTWDELGAALAERGVSTKKLILVVGNPLGVPFDSHVSRVAEKAEGTPILLLTSNVSKGHVAEVIRQGVNGYLWSQETDMDLLVAAIELTSSGLFVLSKGLRTGLSATTMRRAIDHSSLHSTGPGRLTKREQQVYQLVGRSLSNRAIATQLGISIRTVQVYVSTISEKLRVRSRTELAILAAQDSSGGIS